VHGNDEAANEGGLLCHLLHGTIVMLTQIVTHRAFCADAESFAEANDRD
jgi:hypothetical protein